MLVPLLLEFHTKAVLALLTHLLHELDAVTLLVSWMMRGQGEPSMTPDTDGGGILPRS